LQFSKLKYRVEHSGCALVQGSFRSGKSTHLFSIYDDLLKSEEYYPLVVTLFGFSTTASEQEFWELASQQLRDQIPTLLGDFTNATQFAAVFSNASNHFQGKKAVLLVDEMQVINDNGARRPFLEAIKALMDMRNVLACLTAVLCFGTYSLDTLVATAPSTAAETVAWHSANSPFPRENTIYIEPLPEERTKELFVQFGNDKGITFASDVLDDIYTTTNGYAGIVGFVGLQLANTEEIGQFRVGGLVVDMNLWLQIRALLPQKLVQQEQFQKLTKQLRFNRELGLYVWALLAKEEPFAVTSDEYVSACALADYGLIRFNVLDSTWSVSSILIRELIYSFCAEERPDVGFWPATIVSDMRALLSKAISFFNLATLWCCGVNKTTNFPPEFAFQGELFAVLRQAFGRFPGNYIVMLEAKSGGNKRADIIVQNGTKIVIETKAAQPFSGSNSVLDASVTQVVEYATKHSASVAILVNFTFHQVYSPIAPIRVGKVTVHIFQVVCTNDFNMTIV